MKRLASACAASALLVATACSAGGTGGPAINSVSPSSPSYGALQFAVGTANIYGSAQPGLNVVSTFRQTNGASATGVNTPTVTGPFTFAGGVGEAVSTGGSGDPYSTIIQAPSTATALQPGNVVPGPSLLETIGSPKITGTPQTVKPGTPNCDGNAAPAGFISCQGGIPPNTTTFGQSGGVFALGIAPYNSVAATGQSYSYQPYAQPFFAANALPPAGHVAFIPWGGPPAFDPDGTGMGERDGLAVVGGLDSFNNPFYIGVAEGITAFDGLRVGAGEYTLSVAIATVGNGGAITISTVRTSAQLHSTVMLPTLTAPVVKPDGNGDGGATFTTSLPSGVTEAYVQIVDYGPGGGPNNGAAGNASNCQGARGTTFAPVYYTIHATRSKTFYVLPPTIGPNLSNSGGVNAKQPSPTLCTAAQNTAAAGSATPADDYVVQMIGFNYPIYQAALGLTQATTPEKPQITGPSGQSDVTISVPMEQDQGSLTPVPASARRAIRPAIRTRR
jgi:hypothetical protein